MITGAATTSTLHESRLKIIFRSVESDSESSSEVTKSRLRISENFWNCNFAKSREKSQNFKKFQKTRKFQKKSVISRKLEERNMEGGKVLASLHRLLDSCVGLYCTGARSIITIKLSKINRETTIQIKFRAKVRRWLFFSDFPNQYCEEFLNFWRNF